MHTRLVLVLIALDQSVAVLVLKNAPNWAHSQRLFTLFPAPIALALAGLFLGLLWIFLPRYQPILQIIAAGWVSNLITWTWHHSFIDYVPTGISYINIADIAVLYGVVVLSIRLLKSDKYDTMQSDKSC